ncbi:hypothetical protein G4228_000685, partial [Cervus hanglu yarkandensis]
QMTFCIWLVLWLLTCLKSYWFLSLNFPSLLSHSPAYEVSISGNTVELTCPLEPESGVKWKKSDELIPKGDGKQLLLENFSEMENSGYYQCYITEGSTEMAHKLYLKARVCENCMEVDLMVVVTIIVVDICVTLGLLLLVYYWSKSRKAKATPMTRGAGAGGRPRGQNRERPPPVPNPDYESVLLRRTEMDMEQGKRLAVLILAVTFLQVCQNCIELNPATVVGFIFTEIVSIFLLAVGVYFIAGQEEARQSRASDKQTLLNNDQLYQPLKEREDDQYSHLRKN